MSILRSFFIFLSFASKPGRPLIGLTVASATTASGGVLGALVGSWWLGALIAALVLLSAAGTRMQYEREAEPNLVFGDPAEPQRQLIQASSMGGTPPIFGRFVHIPVANSPRRPKADAWARDVIADITYYGSDEKSLFVLRGRWANSPQASTLAADEPIPPQRHNFPPNGESEPLEIAVKGQSEYDRHSYGYNTESWRRHKELWVDEWKLEERRHYVHVALTGSGVRTECWLLLENHSERMGEMPGFDLRLTKVEAPAWSKRRTKLPLRRQGR